MRAIEKKLKSRSGATILMALLFLLVAVTVSTVIIAAANTATKTVAARKDNQQAYLNVSSAAEYLRDAIQQETAYQAVVQKAGVTATNPNGSSQTLTTSQRSGIIKIVDGLFTEAFGSNNLSPFPVDPTQATVYTVSYSVGTDAENRTVQADVKLEMIDSDEPTVYFRKFTLTAEYSTTDSSGSPCKMTLKMQGGIKHTTGDRGNDKTQREFYEVVWFPSKTEISRPGLREETA